MKFYLEVLLFIGVMAIMVPFILMFANLFAGAFPILPSSPFYHSANVINAAANNALTSVLVIALLLVVIISIVVDIYAAIKYPIPAFGYGNIIGVFVVVALWVYLNFLIVSTNILATFGYPAFSVYQLFASSYLVTALCAGLLVSAAFHLSGKAQRY